MFDIGASELLLIVVVAVVVIGPKDLPLAMRTAGRWIAKIRRVSNHFRTGLEAMIRGVFPVLFDYGEEMAILHYNWFEMVGVDEFHDILAQSRYTLVLWSQVINAGIEDGSLRAEIDADVTVRVVTSSLHGLIDPKRYESLPSPVSATGFDGLVDEFVTTMMHGLDQNSFSTSSSQHSRISSKK